MYVHVCAPRHVCVCGPLYLSPYVGVCLHVCVFLCVCVYVCVCLLCRYLHVMLGSLLSLLGGIVALN